MAGVETAVREMKVDPAEGSQLHSIVTRLAELQEKGEVYVARMLEHNTPDRIPAQSIFVLISPPEANYEPTPDSLNDFMNMVVEGMEPNGERSRNSWYHKSGSFGGDEEKNLLMPRVSYEDRLTGVMTENEPGRLTSKGVKAARDSVRETALKSEITIFVFPTAGFADLAREIIEESEQPDQDILNTFKEWGTALTPKNREILARGAEGEQEIIEGVKTAIENRRKFWAAQMASYDLVD